MRLEGYNRLTIYLACEQAEKEKEMELNPFDVLKFVVVVLIIIAIFYLFGVDLTQTVTYGSGG